MNKSEETLQRISEAAGAVRKAKEDFDATLTEELPVGSHIIARIGVPPREEGMIVKKVRGNIITATTIKSGSKWSICAGDIIKLKHSDPKSLHFRRYVGDGADLCYMNNAIVFSPLITSDRHDSCQGILQTNTVQCDRHAIRCISSSDDVQSLGQCHNRENLI